MSDSDDPACGSDRHIVPIQRPPNSFLANTSFCSGVPCAISRLALPVVSIAQLILTEALLKIAFAAASTVYGNCMPPQS